MVYSAGAVERAMKVQEVVLRALSGQLTWLQAAVILGRSPRSSAAAPAVRTVWLMTGCWIAAARRPRRNGRRWWKSNACCGSIENAMPTSTCATSCGSRAVSYAEGLLLSEESGEVPGGPAARQPRD